MRSCTRTLVVFVRRALAQLTRRSRCVLRLRVSCRRCRSPAATGDVSVVTESATGGSHVPSPGGLGTNGSTLRGPATMGARTHISVSRTAATTSPRRSRALTQHLAGTQHPRGLSEPT